MLHYHHNVSPQEVYKFKSVHALPSSVSKLKLSQSSLQETNCQVHLICMLSLSVNVKIGCNNGKLPAFAMSISKDKTNNKKKETERKGKRAKEGAHFRSICATPTFMFSQTRPCRRNKQNPSDLTSLRQESSRNTIQTQPKFSQSDTETQSIRGKQMSSVHNGSQQIPDRWQRPDADS